MDSREQMEGFYPELFPKDYPERLERLVEPHRADMGGVC